MVQSDSDFNKLKFTQSFILFYDTYFSHSIAKGKHVKLDIHLHRMMISHYINLKICIRSSMESRRGVSPWRLGFVFVHCLRFSLVVRFKD